MHYQTVFDQNVRFFRRIGFATDEEFFEECAIWLRKRSLDVLRQPLPDAGEIARTWVSCLNAGGEVRDEVRIFVYGLFRELLSSRVPNSSTVDSCLRGLSKEHGPPLTRGGSCFEATRRLLGALYHFGRLGEPTVLKQRTLREAKAIAGVLIANDRLAEMKPAIRRKYHGFRAVSCLLLARTDENPRELYVMASEDLVISGEAGDHSLEHDEYLAETYLYLQEIDGNETWLTKAEAVIASLQKCHRATRRLLWLSGAAALRRGFVLRNADFADEALRCFLAATECFSRALEQPPDATTADDYLLAQRGQAQFAAYTTELNFGSESQSSLLSAALDDLRSPGRHGRCVGYGGATLPRALQMRSSQLRGEGDLDTARSMLSEAQALARECPNSDTLSETIENSLKALDVDTAIRRGDAIAIRDACEQLLRLGRIRRVPFAPLASGARFLLSCELPIEEIAEVVEATVSLAEGYLAGAELEAGARRFIANHAGGLARVLGHQNPSEYAARRVHELYRVALDAPAGPAAPELLGFVGDAALQLGKCLLAVGADAEAAGFFEDACDILAEANVAAEGAGPALSPAFQSVISHSKRGEAALRLNTLTGAAGSLEIAIKEFELSRMLGNDTPEIKGLLADVYLRRGRMRGNEDDLLRCVDLKEQARRAGHATRENLSISARVHFMLGAMRREIAHQREGVALLGQALLADPNWAWPLFQLADCVTSRATLDRREILIDLPADALPPDLAAAFLAGDESIFLERAAECVLRNTEFERRHLGGRRGEWDFVYVVEDPHRLLSESFVFKQTTREKATRDLKTIRGLHRFLREHVAPANFALPKPLHISSVAGAVDDRAAIYLMRRAHGRELGQLVLDWKKGVGPNPQDRFRDSLAFLAHFNAWSFSLSAPKAATGADITDLLRRWMPTALARAVAGIIPTGFPLLRKKDAHPENWLLTAAGDIMMLDFEANDSVPLGLDAAQLLEDYPLLTHNDTGWAVRRELIGEYGRTLRRLGVYWDAEESDLWQWYAAMALARCAFGLQRLRGISRRSAGKVSSSALRAGEHRAAHYRAGLRYLSDSATSAEIRAAAGSVLALDT